MEIDVELDPPEIEGDEVFYVNTLLGDNLGWQHPVTRLCVAMTQSVSAVAANTVIFAFLDLTNNMPMTDGDWTLEVLKNSTDIFTVRHRKAQLGPNFSVSWELSLEMLLRREDETIDIQRVELNFTDKNADDSTQRLIEERIKAIVTK